MSAEPLHAKVKFNSIDLFVIRSSYIEVDLGVHREQETVALPENPGDMSEVDKYLKRHHESHLYACETQLELLAKVLAWC